MLIRHHDFRKRFQCVQTCQEYPRIHFEIRMSEKHQAFSLVITLILLYSPCRFFSWIFPHFVHFTCFFSSYEVHFWGLACQGPCWCSCLAAPHHTNSFIHKKWSNLHKKRRSAVRWLFHFEHWALLWDLPRQTSSWHSRDGSVLLALQIVLQTKWTQDAGSLNIFELWFQKNPCHKFFIQHLFLLKHVILILEWDSALSGLGDLVGYSIRLESKRSFRTKILVCTTGQFCQLDGRIWSFWKGQTIQKPCPKADVFRIKQKLSPSTGLLESKSLSQRDQIWLKHQQTSAYLLLAWIVLNLTYCSWRGVLLRRLENDPQLHNVTHIIVDECCVLRQYFGVKGASETSMASCKLTCACKIRRACFLMIFRVATTVAVAQWFLQFSSITCRHLPLHRISTVKVMKEI